MSEAVNELNLLAGKALDNGASDLDVQPNGDVSFTIDGDELRQGELKQAEDFTQRLADYLSGQQEVPAARLGFQKAREHVERHQVNIPVDFAMQAAKVPCRFHFDHRQGRLGFNIRFIKTAIPSLSSLRVPDAFTKQIVEGEHGFILIAGATGSGKSTTMAAALQQAMDTDPVKLVTYEKPIEFPLKSNVGTCIQKEVGLDIPSYIEATESAMRENASIVMLGEMRDPATIMAGLRLASTGHLVVSTIHSGTAVGTVARVVESAPDADRDFYRNMLSTDLRAILCQRLMKRKGGGRIALHELLIVTDTVRSMISEDKRAGIHDLMTRSRDVGMITFAGCAAELVAQDLVEYEAAVRAVGGGPEIGMFKTLVDNAKVRFGVKGTATFLGKQAGASGSSLRPPPLPPGSRPAAPATGGRAV